MRFGPRFTAGHGPAPRAAGHVAALRSGRGTPRRARWWTHDYPRSRDRDRRHAAQRGRRDRRCRNRYDLRVQRAVRPALCLQVIAARAGPKHRQERGPGRRRGRAWPSDTAAGRARSTPGSTSRPTTTSASPAARPGRPSQAAPMRGSVVNRCAVAGASWRTRRPPRARAVSVVNRCGGWTAVWRTRRPPPSSVVPPTRRRLPGTGGVPDRPEVPRARPAASQRRGESPAPANQPWENPH